MAGLLDYIDAFSGAVNPNVPVPSDVYRSWAEWRAQQPDFIQTMKKASSTLQDDLKAGRTTASPEAHKAWMDTVEPLSGFAGILKMPKGITAYHGSPHNFDKFDLEKIGTGEGAQAYGHGLYFAENEKVAKAYRDTLAGVKSKLPDDVIYLPPEMRQAVMTHARTNADAETAATRAQYMSSLLRTVDRAKIADMIQRVRDAERGRMYQVQIHADPERLLDWDKPLREQTPNVRSVLDKLGLAKPVEIVDKGPDYRAGSRYILKSNDKTIGATNTLDMAHANAASFSNRPGSFLWGEAASSRGDPAASSAFRDAGIPGIKYLDQGSRAKGDGSRNYVIFDDKIIEILKKYGLIPPVGAGLLSGMSNSDSGPI